MTIPPRRLDRAGLLAGVAALTARDSRLARLAMRHGPPPLWARPPGFATLLRIILEQQVSLASAKTLYRRIAGVTGRTPSPGAVLALGDAGLRRLGLTRQKAASACDLAERVRDGRLPLGRLGRLSDGAACAALTSVRGIGPWSAAIYLLMALRRPDVWPRGDLALHHSLRVLEGLSQPPSSDAAQQLAARWSPWRAVAARILWQAYLERPS